MTGPERIWIEGEEDCPYVYDESELADASGPLVGYIRADIHDELVKALREAVEIVHKAYVSATMEAVNAGPYHPLKKQMDTWRARCMRAETDARAALEKMK